MTDSPFRCAPFIKEIGRGPNGGRPLSRDDAAALYAAMLAGRVSDVELGAVLIAYRLKGETPIELAGMLESAQASVSHVSHSAVANAANGAFHPVSIPSYNGARKQPNLTPLLALLLARSGVPVLVHGVLDDPGRVTSAEIFTALGLPPSSSSAGIQAALATQRVAFAPIGVLSPQLARLLALRRVLGVRNSTHTLVKLLQPFDGPALRLVNYTHPPYRDALSALFRAMPDDDGLGALLARGTEGEAVADTRRQVQVDWVRGGTIETLIAPTSRATDTDTPPPTLPEGRDAATTAKWIEDVLADRLPVPETIDSQVQAIMRIVARSD